MTMTTGITTIGEAALGPLEELGRGGQAVVYRAPEATLPGFTGRLVFKRYKQEWLAGREYAVAHSIGRLIALRADTPAGVLDANATWPIAVVTSNDDPAAAVGIVMRELPAACYVEMTLFRGTKRVLWEIGRQLQSPTDLAERGLPDLTEVQRLTVLVRLVRFAAFLHRQQLVLGDLSGSNVVLRRDRAGDVVPMLVDTDGYRFVGQGAHFPQGNTPDWEAPESLAAARRLEALQVAGLGDGSDAAREATAANVQNQRSDVYKLALLVRRLFHHGTEHTLIRESPSSDAALAALIGPTRHAVVRAALAADPGVRPSMPELARALSGSRR